MLALVASPNSEERVEMRTVEDPIPARDETLVRVEAISLNRGEVHRLSAAADGTRFGWDVAGTVERPATDGQGPAAGTRVVGFVYSGGWAEYVAVSNLKLAPILDGVSTAAASTLPVAGLTALRTLRLGGFLLGRRVLVTGASGGVGRFAVQLAADAGAHVTAVSASAGRAVGLREIGATEVVSRMGEAQGAYDLILESVGGDSLAEAVRLVAPAGRIVSFGNSARQPSTIDISPYYAKEAKLIGFLLLSPLQRQDFRSDLGYLLGRMAAGKLDPQIGLEVSWREAASALAALRERRVQGKAVLTLP